jgi:hypothetical protein
LKQAPKAWHSQLTNKLKALRFSSSVADASLFVYMKDRVTIYMLIYVDDIIIVGSLDSAISQLIKQLEHDFVVKDLDCLEYFLGIEVKKQGSGLLMSQKKICT